jgi:DNA-binding GntR family transcriptional regulator
MSKEKISDTIAAEMIEKIRSQEWPPHIKLPSEKILAEQFMVSRNTLREALQILIDRGFVKRQHGTGSTVLPTAITHGMENFYSISELIESYGHKSDHIGVELEIEKPSEKLKGLFNVSEFEPIYRITRIHTVDGNPAVYERIFTPAYTLPGLNKESLSKSILYMRDDAGQTCMYADCIVKAVRPPSEVAKALKQSPNEPVLLLESVHRDVDEKSISYVEDYFSDWFEFPIRRVRKKLPIPSK